MCQEPTAELTGEKAREVAGHQQEKDRLPPSPGFLGLDGWKLAGIGCLVPVPLLLLYDCWQS